MKLNLIKYLNLADWGERRKEGGGKKRRFVSLSGHALLAGHMTDTGECEGQRGCLAPEVRKRKQTSPRL